MGDKNTYFKTEGYTGELHKPDPNTVGKLVTTAGIKAQQAAEAAAKRKNSLKI